LAKLVPHAELNFRTRKNCSLYDNPGADVNELQKVEQEEHDSSHEAEDASASCY
jgi:hypothetical protein